MRFWLISTRRQERAEACTHDPDELLAWQFASPVRWIETQDLALTTLGVDRFVEVGVGSAPTIANMMGQTLTLPQYADVDIEVLNVERERGVVFATDEVVREVSTDTDEADDAAPAEKRSRQRLNRPR